MEGISLNEVNYQRKFQYDVWGEVSIYRQDAVTGFLVCQKVI
jgi:hypothetical protein